MLSTDELSRLMPEFEPETPDLRLEVPDCPETLFSVPPLLKEDEPFTELLPERLASEDVEAEPVE